MSTQPISPGLRSKRACEARLLRLLEAEETVVALGTAEELRALGSNLGSGAGWTFLVLTPNRILFANWGHPDRPHDEIALDDISGWASGTQYNCYALVLHHPPRTRREHVSAHRFLWMRWGDAMADVTRESTIFRFSRRDTAAAKALRSMLEARNVPHESLRFDELLRRVRSQGAVLKTRRWGPTR